MSDRDHWQRVGALFHATIAREREDRRLFLEEACSGADELRQHVERLVRAHEQAGAFLSTSAVAHALRLLASVPESFGSGEAALTSFHAGARFRGTERFTVRRPLGAGGMGVVYEVHDRARDEVVALKTLRRARAADVYRLKREFRSLADVAHPNLVSLYELIVDGANCLFTMELVDGVNFVEYLRGSGVPGVPLRAGRTRHVLRQLVNGIDALHRGGKLHRDVKPSNILVTPEGRVVVLDFGLTSDVFLTDATVGERLAGTPAYQAPERWAGVAPSKSQDWYSVGVTLYEALTGRRPFEGSIEDVRRRTGEFDPPPPASIEPDTPDDLNEICLGWLCRDPDRRLSGSGALEKLVDRGSLETGRREPSGDKRLFVGRTRPLAVLTASFAAVRDGAAATVCIHGPSGIGKTALVEQFLQQVSSGVEAVVLRGRCYQHESVPYEALDGIVDSLSLHLRALPPAEVTALVPPDAGALARVFPVMQQVKAVPRASSAAIEHADPSAQRRLAFSALRELLTRIAQRHPLVLHIDDLHWADADSMRVLDALLRPPDAPPLLLLACLRTEEIVAKPFLQAFLQDDGSSSRIALSLDPMTPEETQDVMTALIPAAAQISAAERFALACEARGNPFLVEQLAHYAAVHEARGRRDATIVDMVQHRLHGSPDGARRFLDVLALCARPMRPRLVYEAAGLTGDERPLVAVLGASHLLRHSGSASHIEMYHDRMRETLAAHLSADDTRDIHGILVRTLTARGIDDPEALFEHHKGAGDRAGAAEQAARAATKAQAVLAFDRAAVFYRSALQLMPGAPAAAGWTQGLAEALTNGGRPAEAARVYLEASSGARSWPQVELRRRAAEQFLIGGHIDRGMDVIRSVLLTLQMQLAPSPKGALASLLWRRARIRWRGLAFVARDAHDIPADRLLRIDTCWSMTTGLAMVDTIRAAEFNARHLLLALDAGEPYRIARALAIETGLTGGAAGGGGSRYAAKCGARAARLASESGHPHAEGLWALTAGALAFLAGEWKEASPLCERALVILRDQCMGVTWEMNCAQVFALGALLYQGEMGEASRRLPALLDAARDRGNRFFETELRTAMYLVWLAADEPEEGERQADAAMEGWSHQGFHRQHYKHVLARIQAALYRGDAEAAWRGVADNWAAWERTLLLRVQFLRIEALFLRARAALLNAACGREVGRFLSIARRDARRIRRVGLPWSDAIAILLSATVTHLGGRRDACDMVAAAVAAFERADMMLHAAVARRRLGVMQDSGRGRALVTQADAWMAAHGIRNPARMARLIAPGLPGSDDV